jgi:hypothetical protein
MKVVGLRKRHIYTKNRVNIRKFSMELIETMVIWIEKPSKVLLGGIFFEEFLYETLVWHV